MEYREIHIWEFPPTRTFIHLNDNFRKKLFLTIKNRVGIKNILQAINKRSKIYHIKRNYDEENFRCWVSGFRKDKSNMENVNIPLWVLIEISKILSSSEMINNETMKNIEKHIIYYTGLGKAIPIKNPKLPILVTPEMTSIVFHLCGDGHVGSGMDSSHYRQTNKDNLDSFLEKLQNIFGEFKVSIFEDSKLIIPRIITDFYKYYFGFSKFSWSTSRIPKTIKNMSKDFLLAGLTAFIIDEGHIGDFIEIYSKNYHLISDISEITLKLGYKISKIEKKYRYGRFDSYRFIIRPESLPKLYREIELTQTKFPICGLAHKSEFLKQIVRIRNRGWERRGFGITKSLILNSLENNKATVREIATKTDIRLSSVREHLLQLERKNLINRAGKAGRKILWASCDKVK
jgi:DNA-binding transcriptional ArsR family regulator